MNRRLTIVVLIVLVLGLSGAFVFWYYAQPVWWSLNPQATDVTHLPIKNSQLISVIEKKGKALAPSYNDVVCTEFVIKSLEMVTPLSKEEKRDIRIITSDNLTELLEKDSPLMKGVVTALVRSGQGIDIKADSVKAGDLVQFWSTFAGSAYGHCGVVVDIAPGVSITMYSSHPITNGFGKQTFGWPNKAYFVRLK